MKKQSVYIGTAGWGIPKEHAAHFPGSGAHLERYARRLNAAEINTTFYRPHRPVTYARWADSVPGDFRFAVKIPKEITHESRLEGAEARLESFLEEVFHLGEKLGPLLVQLPPGLRFKPDAAGVFFAALRSRFAGNVVCEPRHASWFAPEPEALLAEFKVARAAADPPPHPLAAQPAGWPGLVYYRLHGSPRMYASPYPPEALDRLAVQLLEAAARGAEAWCIFDNTAEFAAAGNALELVRVVEG